MAIRRAGLAALLAMSVASCGSEPAPDYAPKVSEADRETGAEQHPALLAEFGGAYAGEDSAYVARLGEKIAVAAGLGGQCTFTLVNSDVVNAFAVPGCYIYVTRGLMAIVSSEAELASVLGHELGHVVGQHSERQERKSLWRTLGVLAVSLAGSDRLTQIAGEAAQFFTLRYSRKQEYESDSLGIRYLQAAGYDPYAAADMLGALQRQEAYLSATGGRDEARGIPEWARSHPLTENRIEHARELARATGLADDALPENGPAYLREVDGLLYGDDPAQGFVLGRRFAHPVIRIGFEAPVGFTLTNSPRSIRLAGPDGVQGEFGGGPIPAAGLQGYAEALIGQVIGDARADVGPIERRMVNGLPTLILHIQIETPEGILPLGVAVYDAGGGDAYHFVMVSPPADGSAAAIDDLFASFHLLTPGEVAQLRPRFIRVVEARPGDTAEVLAGRMAGAGGVALFRALNGLEATESVSPGELVKLVVPDR